MADLNKENEDNAEPPELHCCKHCAKDVALRTMLFLLGLVVCYESYQGAWDEIPEDVLNGVTCQRSL